MQEVKVPNTSYSKLVAEDGSVAVLMTNDYAGWSSWEDPSVKHQMMFDSRIVRYVLSGENKKICENDYNDLMKTIFPLLKNSFVEYSPGSIGAFWELTVKFIPKDTLFRIGKDHDEGEYLEIFDPRYYFTA